MDKIAISIFVLSITLYGAVFEHSTDLIKKYEFDSKKQKENEKLAAELDKFINNTVSQQKIEKYLELRDDDNQTKAFAKDIYVDSAILKQRGIEPTKDSKTKEKQCGWFYSLFGCKNIFVDLYESISESLSGTLFKNLFESVDTNSSESEVSENVAEEKGTQQ